jgi:hypothetical protein
VLRQVRPEDISKTMMVAAPGHLLDEGACRKASSWRILARHALSLRWPLEYENTLE